MKKKFYPTENLHKAQCDQFTKVKRRQRLIYKEQVKLAERLTTLENSVGRVAKDAKVIDLPVPSRWLLRITTFTCPFRKRRSTKKYRRGYVTPAQQWA